MTVSITHSTIKNILTRSSGYLKTVCSHSLQPYRGCTYGSALCGVGCYVQHNGHVLRGRTWGSFLEVRDNAPASYLEYVERESHWARRRGDSFSIFFSSATDPFIPQERKFLITHRLLEAMREQPPDELIVQTHSHHVLDELPQLLELNRQCRLRVHLSIESDKDRLPGLPPPASSVARRIEACKVLKESGIWTVVTVAPLLPIDQPEQFFLKLSSVADAVVIDHYIGGDGTQNGSRTERTSLPAAMAAVHPASIAFSYREEIVAVARRFFHGKIGVGIDGFAGRYLN